MISPKKPQQPKPDDEEEDEEEVLTRNTKRSLISVGDITIHSSNMSVPRLREQVEEICKSKPIKNYLRGFNTRKMISPQGIG